MHFQSGKCMSCHAFKLFINNVHWLHLIGSTVTASTNISNSFCTLWLEYIVEISQSSPHRLCKSLAYFHLANYRFSFCYVSLRRLQQALPFGTKHCSGTSKWIKLICKENFELQGTDYVRGQIHMYPSILLCHMDPTVFNIL